MTTKTWNNSWGDFNNPANWSPAGSPQAGDTAVIASGFSMMAWRDMSQTTVDLGSDSPTTGAWSVFNSVLGNITVHGTVPPSGPARIYPIHYGQLNVSGSGATDTGTVSIGATDPIGQGVPGNFNVYLGHNSQFVEDGSFLIQAQSQVAFHGDNSSAFANNGSFREFAGYADIDAPVIGSGTFDLARGKFQGSHISFEQSVGSGENVVLEPASTMTLDDPGHFFGHMTVQPTASVTLKNIHATSYDFTGNALTLYQNGTPLVAYVMSTPANTGLSIHSGTDTVITGVAGLHPSSGLIG